MVWIYTDMSDKTLKGDNHAGTINDPDDISAMAGYLLMANEFDTRGIVVASTHRKEHAETPNQGRWARRVFGRAYLEDRPALEQVIGGYPESLPFRQSSIKDTGDIFNPTKGYRSLKRFPTVFMIREELKQTDGILHVLCWGSLTEPAILVQHLMTLGREDLLTRLCFIAHWTDSSLHQGSPEHPEDVANCREDAAACEFMKWMAKRGHIRFYECGAIGQHGIVGGAPKGSEYYDQFKTSQLGTLFAEGKFTRGKVDHSDSATYWVLLGKWGVSLKDLKPDGSNTAKREKRNEDKFREASQRIHDELLRRSKIAGKESL